MLGVGVAVSPSPIRLHSPWTRDEIYNKLREVDDKNEI